MAGLQLYADASFLFGGNSQIVCTNSAPTEGFIVSGGVLQQISDAGHWGVASNRDPLCSELSFDWCRRNVCVQKFVLQRSWRYSVTICYFLVGFFNDL